MSRQAKSNGSQRQSAFEPQGDKGFGDEKIVRETLILLRDGG
jgi:hypothetical protein